MEKIDWLKDIHRAFQLTTSPQGTQIIQYNYKEECVFLIDDCYDCADGLNKVYDVEQNLICKFGGIADLNTCPNFETEAVDSVILWDNVNYYYIKTLKTIVVFQAEGLGF